MLLNGIPLRLRQRFTAARLPITIGCLAAALIAGTPSLGAAPEVRFSRDIRPILSENCFACHGPDQKARKVGLRLDTKEGLYESSAKHGPAFVLGNPDKSPAWQRITTADPDDLMPPPESHKTLSSEQKERVRRWILEGALWQGHWAYVKPERPEVPKVRAAGFVVRNPIDAFILQRLQAQKLRPAPEADRRAIARRLALDVTGLPPAAELLEAFLRDRAPDAYEQLLKRFLAMPQWGEHRARYWLDAARYADTHGLHFDNYREMWPYRDWVIRAFNRNLPFDRFTIEQLAGDLLENASDEEKVATGFQRCNMTTNEGGTIEDENLANYANDRVTTTGWVWLGATLNCCACHDHKFDPFTTKDFYSLAAFYRNTTQSGFDKNRRESDLFLIVPQTESERARWHALPGQLNAARRARETKEKENKGSFDQWLSQLNPQTPPAAVELTGELVRVPLLLGDSTNLPVVLQGRHTTRTLSLAQTKIDQDAPLGPAPILTKANGLVLGDLANFNRAEPFSAAAWVKVPEGFKGEGSILARMGGDDALYRGWDFYVRNESFGMHLSHRWSTMGMAVAANDKSVKPGQWQHLAFTYDGSGRAAGVKLFVNGVEVGANRDQNSLEGPTTNSFALRVGRREKGNELDGVALQDVRLYDRRLLSTEVRALFAGPRLAALLAQTQAEPTNPAPADALRDYYLVTSERDWQQAAARFAALEREQQDIRGHSPVTLVQEEKTNSMAMAQILFRGQYDKPKDKVTAATPAALPAMSSTAPKNRLGLAEWLVGRDNPLTARVIVNRYWQEVFGVGLVKSTEDFGTTGEPPSHPELLDWLAVEFQESGWDVKHLFELMLTSSTYRQAAQTTPEKLEKDPQNRLLSRGPRFRMDAELIRDYALASSGLLRTEIGGPSVKPYQPPGVWEAVAMVESNTRFYEPGEGDSLYRRSLYTFWKRAAPPASMDLFNAPSRETCVVRRERTNTPLQALATLNDPQFVEAARHLAEVALAANPRRPEAALETVAQRLLLRRLASEERAVVRRTLADMQTYYDAHLEAAQQLVRTGASPPDSRLPLPSLAALTMVANQLMNLDEVLNK